MQLLLLKPVTGSVRILDPFTLRLRGGHPLPEWLFRAMHCSGANVERSRDECAYALSISERLCHMVKHRVAVIGAGGHGTVVASTLQAAGHEVVGFYADVPSIWGTEVLGIPVVGPISELSSAHCSHAIIGIGDNMARKRIAQEVDIDWITVVHPFAWVHQDVPLGAGTIVCAGSIVQPDAMIGEHVILNTKASVDHHCRVGDYAHIAVAHLAGRASIDEGVFMALGCTVLPKLHVGAWATVGAGAVVTKNVAPHTTVVGVPAKVLATGRQASVEAA